MGRLVGIDSSASFSVIVKLQSSKRFVWSSRLQHCTASGRGHKNLFAHIFATCYGQNGIKCILSFGLGGGQEPRAWQTFLWLPFLASHISPCLFVTFCLAVEIGSFGFVNSCLRTQDGRILINNKWEWRGRRHEIIIFITIVATAKKYSLYDTNPLTCWCSLKLRRRPALNG